METVTLEQTKPVENEKPAIDPGLKAMVGLYGDLRMRMGANPETRELLDKTFAQKIEQWAEDSQTWAKKESSSKPSEAAITTTHDKPVDTLQPPPITPETAHTL